MTTELTPAQIAEYAKLKADAARESERQDHKMRFYDRFSSEYELARYNSDFGYHWFDADSKRFFRSRVGAILHGDSPALWNIFISSEQFDDGRGYRAARRYTVRQLRIDGSIEDISEFQEYASSATAKRAALRYIQANQHASA